MKKKEGKYSVKPHFMQKAESISGYGTHITVFLLFVLSFGYLQWYGSGVFFHQESKSMFIFSLDYLSKYLSRPGGLLVYAGNFLTQGYFSTLSGSLVNSILFIILFLVLKSVVKQFSQKSSTGLFLILLLPLVLIVCQANYNYYIFHTMGFLSVALWFRISVAAKSKTLRIILLILFPLFYYITGTFALVFAGMYILYCSLTENGNEKYLFPLIHLAVSLLSVVLFYKLIFLQPVKTMLGYPFVFNDYSRFTIPLLIAAGLIILYPLLIKLSGDLRLKISEGYIVAGSIFILFPAIVLILVWQYNPVLEGIMKTEKMFIDGQTDKVISHFERYPSNSIIELFYYNLALSRKGQLCDRMFSGRQSNGPMSLSFEGNRDQASRTMYYYYNLGLVNEARHLAFEQFVQNGYTPGNIKMLIRTELINSNFKVAERYLNVLKKTWKYRSWAEKHEKYLFNPELVKADPEFGEIIKIMPENDFFILTSETMNIDLLIKSNPLNRKAFEYKMARLLLEKDLIEVSEQVKHMKGIGYSVIPKHIDEAIVAYRIFAEKTTDTGGLVSDNKTLQRFIAYSDIVKRYGGDKLQIEKNMKRSEKNTFWYYLQFGTVSGNFMRSNPVDRSIY